MAKGHTPDDWPKTRKRSQHFTKAEKDEIRKMYREGKTVREAARALGAASTTLREYYIALREEGFGQGLMNPGRAAANYTARLYKGNFEI